MKSIRLSLLLFILALQGLALAAVLGLCYRTTSRTLAEKDDNTFAFLRAENETRCEALRDKLDAEILYRATELSSLAQSRWGQTEAEMYSWWAAQAATSPLGGPFQIVTWAALTPDGNIAPQFTSRGFVKLQDAADGIVRREKESRKSDYFQVYDERGIYVKRSDALPSDAFSLPETIRAKLPLFSHEYDYADLEDGTRVRRVTVKMPVASVKRGVTRLMYDGRDTVRVPFADMLSPSPNKDRSWKVPSFFIQYGRDVRLLEQSIASYQSDFEFDLAERQAQSAETAASLRNWVLGLGAVLFAATAAGSFWLIHVGLSPLHRLTDAVSRISPKDFRLPFDAQRAPQELRPICGRLSQALTQLERAFAREKQAAADISHELRTPLTALLTTLDVGLRRTRTPEQYAELLQECRAIGGQLSQLVERLLALARIDAGADTVRAQEVDVPTLTEQCVALVKPLAEARALKLNLRAPQPMMLTTDANKLREIITNLLHNAVEYNRPNGAIDVAVERQNGHMCVHVTDTGIGIEPHAIHHIFERFYRADESRHAESLHAGLGLSIVKSYLEVLGGSIQVRSTVGEGSTFTVQFPMNGSNA